MIEHDRTVHNIPMSEIFSDEEFNCRGKIPLLDVIDLARDIQANGLDLPITVMPFKGHPPCKWRIVAGHRRHAAFRVNAAETIPCTIRADLDEFGAACLNMRENILRKELNIKQEANGLKKFMLAGWSEPRLATELQQSRGWVQVRFMLLRLPEAIQNEAAAGWISQDQIRKIHNCKGEDAQFALLRAIKEAKVRGEKVDIPAVEKRNHVIASKTSQKRPVIFEMIDHLMTALGAGLETRCLAWAAGEISDYELYRDIETHCKENSIFYELPSHILEAFTRKVMDHN